MTPAQIKLSKYYAWALLQKRNDGKAITPIQAQALATYWLASLHMLDLNPAAVIVPPAPTPAPAPAPAPVPPPVPVVNNLTASFTGDVLTVIYKGKVIAQGKTALFSHIVQISPNRIDLRAVAQAGKSATLPRFTFPVPPTNLGGVGWPITATSGAGPAIATYKGDGFSFTAASVDPDVTVYQNHGAPNNDSPELRDVGIACTSPTARTLTLSLCVDAEDLGGFTTAFVQANPLKMKWPDRRPIIMTATDPTKSLGSTLAAQAAAAIATCKGLEVYDKPASDPTRKKVGGQGVIYWDLTGVNRSAGMPADKTIEYDGCPENTNACRPLGDTIETLAAAHKLAGVPWGVCIRPWTWNVDAGGIWTQTGDGVSVLAAKLTYLLARGASLVYVDSCPIDAAAWLADLQAKFPTMLIIPEAGNAAQEAYGAPLRDVTASGGLKMLTDLYPGGFQTVFHCDGNQPPEKYNGLTDEQFAGLMARGHVILVEPWESRTMKRFK